MQKIIENAKRQIEALSGKEVEITVRIISEKKNIQTEAIITACIAAFNANREQVLGKSGGRVAVDCRKIIAYYLRLKKALPDEAIAIILKKDRTTVLHYRNSLNSLISINDDYILKKIDEVKTILE